MKNKSKRSVSERKDLKEGKSSQINRLAAMLGMGSLNGTISLAAISGLFKLENAFVLAVLFMAGPGAIITAFFLDGNMKERMFAALSAGLIATIIVILAAGIGTKALEFFNMDILRITGGVAILIIGLLIMGLKINENIPFAIILLGLIAGLIWR
jgi:uncharacterized membrane protein YjjP (DUF1212 family)